MTRVKVFGSPTSSEVARVLVCLFEKNVEFQLTRVDIYNGLEKKPEYLKLQSNVKALTFEDDVINLVESREICRYICEKYKDQGNTDILGTGEREKKLVDRWLQIEADKFEPLNSDLVFDLIFLEFAPTISLKVDSNKEAIEEYKKKLGKVLDVYEQRLQETRFLAGDKFTLADLSHLPDVHRLIKSTWCADLFASRKMVTNWWKEISSRASWKKVMEMQVE
ncbi:glutathione S-transferase F11-like [Dioscorea cayenensis subsp. rotundata]|uniref:glutathione transferase n=1 Tax=Dioscorea cayennensis subsp. rotundata TaxID=55577 RepID=A0AB40CQ66_DIOCR|nr:glutathione S-transferase F11-like [Dioscorea cayenensis subsp. rotundata]